VSLTPAGGAWDEFLLTPYDLGLDEQQTERASGCCARAL
jgi:hypothetical protein